MDLINPEFTEGKLQHITWLDEICASCKNEAAGCPLLQVIYQFQILTSGGIRVSKCLMYDPDKDSPNYVAPGDVPSVAQAERAMEQAQGEMQAILKTFQELTGYDFTANAKQQV